MANLHVGDVAEGIGTHHVAITLEHHRGDGPTRLHVTIDHLGDDIQTSLLVGDSLYDSNGQSQDRPDEERYNVSPPRKVSVPSDRGGETKGEADGEDGQEPPLGSFPVFLHQFHVNIGFLVLETNRPVPDVPAVEESDVDNSRYQGGEAQAIAEGESWSKEKRRVLLIGGLVESDIRVENFAGVVGLTKMVKVGICTTQHPVSGRFRMTKE